MSECYIINPLAYVQTTDDGCILIDPTEKNVIFLGEIEQFVFNLVLGCDESQIVAKAMEVYEGDGIQEDIHLFLRKLFTLNILIMQPVAL